MSRDNYKPSELAAIHSSMAMCEAQTVIGEVIGDNIYMESPYNPTLVQLINNTKPKLGRWNAAKKQWVFPREKEDKVRAIYKKVYGEDGFSEAAKVVVSIDVDKAKASGIPFLQENRSIWFLGKQIARTWDNKSTPKPMPDTTVIQGGFEAGGSANKATVEFLAGTKIVLNDVPEDVLDVLLDSATGAHGIEVIGSVPSAVAIATGQASAATPNTPSGITPSGNGSGNATAPNASSSATGKAPEATYDDLPLSGKVKVTATKALVKAMALRASQVPRDQAEVILRRVGLKFKA